MKGCAVTQQGIEDISAAEIIELIGADAHAKKGVVLFEIKQEKDICTLCYASQSLTKVLLLLGEFNYEDAAKVLEAKKIGALLQGKSFSVRCFKIESDRDSHEVEAELGALIAGRWKAEVNLESPDIQITAVLVGDYCYVGIDFSREDLGKREYRIFTGADILKATTAYAAIKFSGFRRGETLVDPFCRSGTIAIEAALYDSRIPVNLHRKKDFFFSRMGMQVDYGPEERPPKDCRVFAVDSDIRKISSAKKNAKIADVHKHISFSRQDLKFLELKFGEGTVDRIVTFPPHPSRHSDEKKVKDSIEEFFYQAAYILKENGAIVFAARKSEFFDVYARKHGFLLEDEREVWQGREKLLLLKLKKA